MFSRRSECDGEIQEDDSERKKKKKHLYLTRGSQQFLDSDRGIEVEK